MTIALLLAAILLQSPSPAPNERPVNRRACLGVVYPAAIRADIDRIFQAFIHKDGVELRATHAPNWLGYLEGSRTVIAGVDAYMKATGNVNPDSPYGMKTYKMREFNMIFQGDAAFVCFVAEVEALTPTGPSRRLLRIADFYTKQNGQWIQTGSDTELHPETAAESSQMPRALPDQIKTLLLEARESVWRSYFGNDRATLERLVPEDTITMDASSTVLGNRARVLEGAAAFAKSGATLARLEIPTTEIQCYGNTAIVYSTYRYDIAKDGKTTPFSGRVTEVFVFRRGQWVNPGWHMDSVK